MEQRPSTDSPSADYLIYNERSLYAGLTLIAFSPRSHLSRQDGLNWDPCERDAVKLPSTSPS